MTHLEYGTQQRVYGRLGNASKSFSLVEAIAVGVDRMQRNFEPMRKEVEARRQSKLTDVTTRS